MQWGTPHIGQAMAPCGALLVCAQAAKWKTMRLFLPLSSATVLTLRALIGWFPWEPELPILSHQAQGSVPTADGYSSQFFTVLDRGPCACHQVFKTLQEQRHKNIRKTWDFQDEGTRRVGGLQGTVGPRSVYT